MEHVLVRVGPDEWEVFRDVRLRSLAESPEAFGSRYADWVDAPEERWRDRLTTVPLTLLAPGQQPDGPAIGVASGAVDAVGRVELISMWVAPEARGTGVAAALIEAVVGWAEAEGRATYLMVRSENTRAIAAYEKAGFVDRGVPDDWPPHAPPENRMEHVPRRGHGD